MKTNLDSKPIPQTPTGATAAVKTLPKHPFLEGLSPHQLRLLGDCAMVVRFQPGELIFREGDPANRFYLITKGKVALESYVQDRGTTLIQTVAGGDVLGWSWLFPPYYWHFDARSPDRGHFLLRHTLA